MSPTDLPAVLGVFRTELLHCCVRRILEPAGFRLVGISPRTFSQMPEVLGPVVVERSGDEEPPLALFASGLGTAGPGPRIRVSLAHRMTGPGAPSGGGGGIPSKATPPIWSFPTTIRPFFMPCGGDGSPRWRTGSST